MQPGERAAYVIYLRRYKKENKVLNPQIPPENIRIHLSDTCCIGKVDVIVQASSGRTDAEMYIHLCLSVSSGAYPDGMISMKASHTIQMRQRFTTYNCQRDNLLY